MGNTGQKQTTTKLITIAAMIMNVILRMVVDSILKTTVKPAT